MNEKQRVKFGISGSKLQPSSATSLAAVISSNSPKFPLFFERNQNSGNKIASITCSLLI